MPANLTYECRRQRAIARALAVTATPLATVFSFTNFVEDNFIEAAFDAVLAVFAIVLWLTATQGQDSKRSYTRVQVLLFIFIVCFVSLEMHSIFAGHQYSRLLWFFPFPLLVFLTLGQRLGLMVMAVFMLTLAVLLSSNFTLHNTLLVTAGDVWRFMGSLLIMCLAGYFLERELRRDRVVLLDKQQDLERSESQYRQACLNLVQEIDQRNHEEQSRQGLVEQLRQSQKMEALGQLAGGVVHDFNNLLGSMMGFTHMAHQEAPLGSAQKKKLALALEAGNKAKRLLRELLDFSRHDEPDREPLYLGKLVRGALELMSPLLTTGIKISVLLPEDGEHDLAVEANAVQLEQVIFNLCQNASQAMAPLGGRIGVELSRAEIKGKQAKDLGIEPGEYALLAVRDTGPGLSLPVFERIFDPFFTTKEKGKGTGMGLFVTRSIVEAHGGRIQARNRSERGAEFTVYLPLTQARPLPEADLTHITEVPRGKGQRVLYVDDEIGLASTVHMLLEDLGYQVVLCGSGEEALKHLRDRKPGFDLVISDQNMEGMRGEELAQECHRLYPGLPVIITTGQAGLKDSAKLEALGVDGVLTKPVSASQMARAVSQALGGSDNTETVGLKH
jgi:signal transduction histidine kinase/ActR/RegA family two-component response regulator